MALRTQSEGDNTGWEDAIKIELFLSSQRLQYTFPYSYYIYTMLIMNCQHFPTFSIFQSNPKNGNQLVNRLN